MANTYPYGYARPPGGGPQGMGTMLTWEQMMAKTTVKNLHPEVRRRFKALIEFAHSQGVPLGVGTGWRVQPNPPPPGFAKPGNSWHESCPVSPTTPSALAIDTVPDVSWTWMERNCGAYGFRTFRLIGNEPWHIQPVEITASRRYATTLPSFGIWRLPGEVKPPTTTPTPQPETPLPGDDSMTIRIFESFTTPKEFNAMFFAECDSRDRSIELQWSGSGDDPKVQERIAVMRDNFGPSLPLLLAGVKNNRLHPKHKPSDIKDSAKKGGWSEADFAP
jgi:hypothetical protein